ncbi:5'-methylthioadenosine/adenosylhomocysteine nucleosidase [Paenibacillus segetis]|uniref:adenosylhomocysteine nucleosidase n=1 Tax=Paenibacillus segetis TaxID=1325360 RepID=A0ABQ1YHN7_9BACL|nr:5'-methylthioadenosine/adenosylhomocysteine nucleosidase [Paenibacillus segetis]GGH25857.1 5'-methylthioadenosine/S-adenosylhomocysteine nucleosidase [Paenibacillus segetis]
MIRTIGLMGAMDEEIALLLQRLDRQKSIVHAGITFVTGLFHGKEVVVCKSGVGKVNAAATTQVLVDRFGVNLILFTGVAGAVDPLLGISDIVISSSCQQHDMDVSPLGYARGVIPYQKISDFPADPGLINLAKEACSLLCKDRHFVVGRVLSGDQFISDNNFVRTLHETMSGACVEMEGAAVAQVCYMNEIPYVVVRSMSDKADGTAEINYTEFTVEAATRSFEIVNHMVSKLDTVLN